MTLKLANKRFGRLVAIKDVGAKGQNRLWLCRCDCGNEIKATPAQLGYRTNSCGCLRKETAAKTSIKNRKSDISFLLNNSILSCYVIGFLFADGHIKDSIDVSLQISDKKYLKRIADLFNANLTIKKVKRDNEQDMVRFCASGKEYLEKIKVKFDIRDNKTYNPPSIEVLNKMSANQKIAFLIGFIDGDGHILRQNNAIVIKNHKNWNPIHKWFATFLIPDSCLVKITSENKSQIYIGVDNFIRLKNIITKFNLPVMERKWNGR